VNPASIAVRVFYEGRVQGVGFRWTVKNLANGFDVLGTVRNLEDGRVELEASGDRSEVDAFLQAIEESELRAHIKKVDRFPTELVPGRKGFQIVR
jgi:acylphosphatase